LRRRFRRNPKMGRGSSTTEFWVRPMMLPLARFYQKFKLMVFCQSDISFRCVGLRWSRNPTYTVLHAYCTVTAIGVTGVHALLPLGLTARTCIYWVAEVAGSAILMIILAPEVLVTVVALAIVVALAYCTW